MWTIIPQDLIALIGSSAIPSNTTVGNLYDQGGGCVTHQMSYPAIGIIPRPKVVMSYQDKQVNVFWLTSPLYCIYRHNHMLRQVVTNIPRLPYVTCLVPDTATV